MDISRCRCYVWFSATFACSDSFKRALDRYCGLCITALYFLYLSVVKGALSVFDCSMNEDGVRILDADPSIVCDKVCCSLESCRGACLGPGPALTVIILSLAYPLYLKMLRVHASPG
jgi:hypothetical protein